jgi:hypothetical protein
MSEDQYYCQENLSINNPNMQSTPIKLEDNQL